MTKLKPEDEAKGRFVGSAPQGPPRGGPNTCSTCQSPHWVRTETTTAPATRDHTVIAYADGSLIGRDLDDWNVPESETSAWTCIKGHVAPDDLAEKLDEAFDNV